jgi:hypothetical protein
MILKKTFVCISTVQPKIRYKTRFQKWCNKVGGDLFDLTATQQILGTDKDNYFFEYLNHSFHEYMSGVHTKDIPVIFDALFGPTMG